MDVTFDPAKNKSNMIKHGVSLSLAYDFEWGDALAEPDLRRDYGEDRMVAIGYIGQRLHVVVYVDRVDGRRVISLRKANQREERYYAQS